jgi:hypothetical protein
MGEAVRGAGLGLRSPHLSHILEESPSVPWFEVMADNYLNRGETPHRALEKVRARYPLVFHGVGMDLGSTDPLNEAYLDRLAELIDRYQPAWISDHLCWIGAGGVQSHDLLPLPYTDEVVKHVVSRIQRVQESLGRRILLENLSGYLRFSGATLTEWEFLNAVLKGADCDLLLDVNNVFVNSENLRFDPYAYLDAMPVERVKEIHLAGHLRAEGLLVDNHGSAVCDEVWDLYRHAIRRFGSVPTLIEWDIDIPDFKVVHAEAQKAQRVLKEASLVA